MTIIQTVHSQERDLGGGFVVRRVLPQAALRMVGPFVFFDHMGPTRFAPGGGIDVRPHPHIALATVTYLFAGSLVHRDSLGTVVDIRPGDVNWMTAGRGITHSERSSAAARAAREELHGIQSWVALPDEAEDVPPAFVHYPASALPQCELDRVRATVIAGTAFGAHSPVATLWPTLYVHLDMSSASRIELAPEYAERAVYLVEGDATVAGTALERGSLVVLQPQANVALESATGARLMLLGGQGLPTPRFIWWNFVASSMQRIERAKQRWANGEFDPVPGETDFIPLPPG